jgi:hypothetical protein
MSHQSNPTPATTPCSRPGDLAAWRAAENLHHALLTADRSQPPIPGEIWSLHAATATDEAELLLAVIADTHGEDTITVVPLSGETRHATEWDLVIPANVLGYPVVAQAKLTGTVTSGQLEQRLSSLPDRVQAQLQELSDTAEQGASIPPAHLPVGPWVLDEADERLRARALGANNLRAYLHATIQDPLSEWGSFSSIVVHQSTALGVPLEEMLEPSWARKLATGELDLLNHVPARKIAALLADLHIRWSERVRDSLYRLVLDRYSAPEILGASALGRRQSRRASHAKGTPASREQGERAACDYVAAVEKALREL